MTSRFDFEHYLMAGHGRAYIIAKSDPELYRDRILEICAKDYTYDIKCEGSRAYLTYDLVSLFDDKTTFISAMKERYAYPDTDTDRNLLMYLTDLILCYERQPVIEKYKAIESMIRAKLPLSDIHELCQSFEYLAICLISGSSIKVSSNVMRDIGLWFLSRTDDDKLLNSYFRWFDSRVKEEFGEDVYKKALEMLPGDEGLSEYIRVMSIVPEYVKPHNFHGITADTVLSWIHENPEIIRNEMLQRGLMRMSSSEAKVLAQQLEQESDPDIIAGIVSVFTSKRFTWPLEPSGLLAHADSKYHRLKEQVLEALSLLKDCRIRELGIRILHSGFDAAALRMVINNMRKEDEPLVLDHLNEITITRDNAEIWHGIGSVIKENADNPELPDSLLCWVYESTLCSYCREGIIEKMLERNIMTDSFVEEAMWDARLDIRELIKKHAPSESI